MHDDTIPCVGGTRRSSSPNNINIGGLTRSACVIGEAAIEHGEAIWGDVRTSFKQESELTERLVRDV